MLKKILVATLFAAIASTAFALPAKADSTTCTTVIDNGHVLILCVVNDPGGPKHAPLQQ
jgi:hypothetical protein